MKKLNRHKFSHRLGMFARQRARSFAKNRAASRRNTENIRLRRKLDDMKKSGVNT